MHFEQSYRGRQCNELSFFLIKIIDHLISEAIVYQMLLVNKVNLSLSSYFTQQDYQCVRRKDRSQVVSYKLIWLELLQLERR